MKDYILLFTKSCAITSIKLEISDSMKVSPRRSTIAASNEAPLAVRILTRPSLPSNIHDISTDLDAGVCLESEMPASSVFSGSDSVPESPAFQSLSPIVHFPASAPESSAVSQPITPTVHFSGFDSTPEDLGVQPTSTVIVPHSPVPARRCVSEIAASSSSSAGPQHDEMPRKARNKIIAGWHGNE